MSTTLRITPRKKPTQAQPHTAAALQRARQLLGVTPGQTKPTAAQIAMHAKLRADVAALETEKGQLLKQLAQRDTAERLTVEGQILDFKMAAQKRSYDRLFGLHCSLLKCVDLMPCTSHPDALAPTASDLRREFNAITDPTERAQFYQVFGEQMTTI